ncbi:MAG: hypothetical protein NTX59_03690 [Elusimicrobia bacterium]|nr:hypothetical protein [Elusimicrobiota bacterium]
MNGKDPAERFNSELDGLFAGSRPGGDESDPAAMETARKLFRADFSGDSKIKESLRAELLARARKTSGFGKVFRLLGHNTWLQAAMAAACLLLVLLPIRRTTGQRAGVPGMAPVQYARSGFASPFQSSSVTVSGGIVTARLQEPAPHFPQKVGETAAAVSACGEICRKGSRQSAEQAHPPETGSVSGIFRGVPMAALAGGRPGKFPIEIKKGAGPIKQLKGRRLALPKGSGVVWETEHAVFTLERRAISPEEFFQRKVI